MKKAIFFDIDGTLLNSAKGITTMTPIVKKSIRQLKKDDNYVFIATGRPYAFLCEDILNFGFDGFVLMNGSLVLINNHDSLHKNTLYKKPFNKVHLKKLLKDFDKYKVEYILQDEKYSYLKKDFEGLKNIYDNIGISEKYIKTEYDIENINVYKIEMYAPDEKAVNFCKSLEDENFRYIHYDEFNLFELYSQKDSKASGILKVLDHLNIHLNDSYAFGDGKNDIEMLNTVGCGIAMGNASDDIKNHAHKVTLSVSEDGVAYGINNYIIG